MMNIAYTRNDTSAALQQPFNIFQLFILYCSIKGFMTMRRINLRFTYLLTCELATMTIYSQLNLTQ